MNIRRGMFRVWVCAVAFSASSHAADNDQLLQDRYHLCMDYADARWLEEFRGRCDVLCIDSKNGTWDECLALHDKWDTSSCYLPDAERDRQDRHLEHDKDRCLQEFKAGVTASPYSHSGEKLEDEEP